MPDVYTSGYLTSIAILPGINPDVTSGRYGVSDDTLKEVVEAVAKSNTLGHSGNPSAEGAPRILLVI